MVHCIMLLYILYIYMYVSTVTIYVYNFLLHFMLMYVSIVTVYQFLFHYAPALCPGELHVPVSAEEVLHLLSVHVRRVY